jgi:hypothetical protein
MKNETLPRRNISAVFFDLDATLIHAQEEEPDVQTPEKAVPYGPYYVWLRPCARELIATAGRAMIPLYICTSSERLYADGITRLFDLGFGEQQILGCEHMLSGVMNLAPNSVLIDDLPVSDEIAVFKRRVLGITPEHYFQVPPFTATHFLPEQDLVFALSRFLQLH